MSSSPAIHFRCDSCGDHRDYSGSGIPYGWVEANLKEVDGKEAYALHVCPQCARHAVDEWLPSNTWWGSTENWRLTNDHAAELGLPLPPEVSDAGE